jgi:hypothetical protein
LIKICSSKSNLKVHFRTHIRVKPYTCKYCEYDCMHHSSIKDHLIKNHPDNPHTSIEPGYDIKKRNFKFDFNSNLIFLDIIIILKLFLNLMNLILLILIQQNLLNNKHNVNNDNHLLLKIMEH